MIRNKDKPAVAAGLVNLSLLCVVFAAVGAFWGDLFLASTQWLLVAILLVAYGVYLLLEANFRLSK